MIFAVLQLNIYFNSIVNTNITLTFNYVQQIEKRLVMLYYISIQIPCLPSDDSNDAKDGDAFLFLPDCKVCVSHIR